MKHVWALALAAAGGLIFSGAPAQAEAAIADGWRNGADNAWHYYIGGEAQTGWQQIRDNWYYFDDTGVMQTGWGLYSDHWYYFGTNGSMKTGWLYCSEFDRTWTTLELSHYGINNNKGNCYVKAAVFCELARAMGYDACLVTGLVKYREGYGRHSWVEIDMDGDTLCCDPFVRKAFGLERSYLFHYGDPGTYMYSDMVRME